MPLSAPMSANIPESVDRFEISRILGKGGMGTVYLARDQRLGRYVAIKLLNAEDLGSGDARARFLREARTAASVRHPNIATIYEVGETASGEPFLVMEFCEGETLAQRLKRRPLDTVEILNISRQVASGLAAAHDAGVVHRDIKSANIMLEPSGAVKILDFGLAKLREASADMPSVALSTSGQFFGTLHYLSPEQTRSGLADERSDLFSLGVVMYQMASGHLPFVADGPLQVLEKIRDGEPQQFVPLDPTFPTDLSRIISRLLQKNPEHRYQSAKELLQDLQGVASPLVNPSTTLRHSALSRTVPRPRSSRLWIAIIGLLAVGVAVFFARRASAPSVAEALPQTPIQSMAVLPLNNLAKNERDNFLSVGIADALVTRLQSIPSLQVRPTSAVLDLEQKTVNTREASELLGVDGVLEGHFLAAGELVRVNLQLTDSRTGYNVWATSVDGRRDDLLKLIDEVSERTVAGLHQHLGVSRSSSQSEARSSSPAAFEEYLRARSLNGSLIQANFDAQVKALEEAVRLDPSFAAAYADLAIALSLGHTRGLAKASNTIERAEWYARQAVRLDPNLAQAHLALGRVFVRHEGRYRESAREILAALRLNTNDTHALHSVVTYFVSTGDMQKAQCVGDRIVQLDPSSNEARTRGYWYINGVDPEGAILNAKWAEASNDTRVVAHDIRAVALILQGDVAAAEREAAAVARLAPDNYLHRSLRAMIAAARDDGAAAEAAVRTFEADANRNHWAALRAAQVYARIGNNQKAVDKLQRAAELGHHSWYSLVKHPWLQPLQSDDRFQTIIAKMKADLDDVRDDMIGVQQLICR
jgi:eukaryotic-like serine/threonine-protein kinase